MAGLIDSFMQGYINRVNAQNGGGRAANNTLAAQNTASAFQRLQDAISQDYAQQQEQAKAAGREWKMPSPTERFNDQVQAMILSGDPALQERGLALMTPDAMDKPTDFQRNFEYLKQANPGLTEMQYFQMLHPGPASTRVSVNLPKQEQMVSIDDAQKIVMPDGSNPPVGATYSWVAAHGGRTVKTKDQSESAATGEVIDDGVKAMQAASPQTTQAPIPGTIAELRARPDLLGTVLNTGLNVAGAPQKPADVTFMTRRNQVGMNITRLMSGASASDQDVARVVGMLPNLTDDPATREIKFKAAQAQAKAYIDAARQKGGATRGQSTVQNPQAPKAPTPGVATKRYNPATGRIEEIR